MRKTKNVPALKRFMSREVESEPGEKKRKKETHTPQNVKLYRDLLSKQKEALRMM